MNNKLLIIDTETSGLHPGVNGLLSFAGVVWEDGVVVDEIEIFIFEKDFLIDPESMRINGINIELHRRRSVPPKKALAMLEEFLEINFQEKEKVALAGHNVGFDVSFLKYLYAMGGGDYSRRYSHRLLDTASIMRFLEISGRMKISNPSLDAGLSFFGIKVKARERHSALGDARATGVLLNKLVALVRV